MPSWLVELTKLVPSLAIPGAYGAAAFGLFHWLDKKASGQAKRAISEWLKPLPYDRAAVRAAVVELFDRIYTSPLLSFRAFGRSMLFTLFVAGIFAIGFVRDDYIQEWARVTSIFHVFINIVPFILSNIVTDYLSLFLIRRWLEIKGGNPLVVVLVGLSIGIIGIMLINAVISVLWIQLADGITFYKAIAKYFDLAQGALAGMLIGERFIFAAVGVHLWLLLLALGVVLLQFLNFFISATEKTQWFLKQGRNHPLDAIGYVAAVIVFLTTVALQWIL
jgi:hypothetical protein